MRGKSPPFSTRRKIDTMAKAKKKTTKKKAAKKKSAKKATKKASAKSGEVPNALAIIESKYGRGAAQVMGNATTGDYDVISTGSLRLDDALGIGGLPQGRIVEIYGPESAGKTTLTMHCIAEAQKAGKKAAFVDAEHAFDPGYGEAIGIDIPKLVLSQPSSGEQALDVVLILVESGEYGIVVVDSVAALVPQAEIDGEIGQSHVGLQARLMGQAMRKLTHVAAKTGTMVFFINQLRMKIGVMFGSPETTPGGNALKFWASVRLDVRRIGKQKEGERVVANETRVKVVKNKCAPPFKEAEFDIRYGIGIDRAAELIDVAVDEGVVDKSGAWYSHDGNRIGQGRQRAAEYLRDHPEIFDEIKKQVVNP